jgi:hypothetical protein
VVASPTPVSIFLINAPVSMFTMYRYARPVPVLARL